MAYGARVIDHVEGEDFLLNLIRSKQPQAFDVVEINKRDTHYTVPDFLDYLQAEYGSELECLLLPYSSTQSLTDPFLELARRLKPADEAIRPFFREYYKMNKEVYKAGYEQLLGKIASLDPEYRPNLRSIMQRESISMSDFLGRLADLTSFPIGLGFRNLRDLCSEKPLVVGWSNMTSPQRDIIVNHIASVEKPLLYFVTDKLVVP